MTLILATAVHVLQRSLGPCVQPADSDDDLVRACLAGDRSAFDRLYRRHVGFVHGRLARMIGRDVETEDLVQQVFLEIFRSLPRFRGEAAFSTWVYRVTANVALSALRRRSRRRSVTETDLLPEDVPALDATPEQAARERELCRLVLTLLGELKPEQRIAFVLRHVECMEFEHIGSVVGAEEATVRQRVKAAERKLSERLARSERRELHQGENDA